MEQHKKDKIYWGFLDEYNQITVVRYKSDKQIEITENMPFCRGIFEPCTCIDKVDAYRKFKEKLDSEAN
jgi:hypothetical protein